MTRSPLSRAVAVALSASLALPHGAAAAGTSGFSLSQEVSASGAGSEYISGNYPGAVLMPVNLWGAIAKPGIHHVPTRTDLISLLSLAGGPVGEAELSDITIKRRSSGDEKVLEFDAEEMLTRPGKHSPVLEANDIIVVPRRRPTINPDTAATLGFVGSMLGLVLSGIALSIALKK